jgi:two-component system phosphate regulon sensor histidine kinase PhoR
VTLPKRWISHLGGFAAWLAAALVLGLWFGRISWWLIAALAIYLVRILRNLYVLDRTLQGAPRTPLFETHGLWAEIFARVDKYKSKARSRKKRYHRLLREVRESTGALSDAGIILNGEHEIQWFNPAATRMLGLDPAADVGNRIDNLLRHPDFVRYLAEPKRDPIFIPSPLDDAGRLAVQMVPYGRDQRLVIIRDVTREAQLERTRRDFVANASHELRSPLTVINGYIDALADESDLPDKWLAPVNEMQRQAERMTKILRDLLELSRLEAGDGKARNDFVDVASMLKRMQQEFAAREPALTVALDLQTDMALLGSEQDLHSVFHNLVSNAVRFTPAGGRVAIVWRAEDSGAAFEVIDTGVGIAAEHLPRITERFYRVDPGRSRATGGTGLGLAIVKHALQRHNATLGIQSQEGVGSTFSCHFPASRIANRGGAARAAV